MSGKEKDVFVEPLTRIEGHLAIHARADVEQGKYVDAHSYGTMFRGIEIILRGREPADAIWITQRLCGVCPVPHGMASVQAVDMAYGVSPPPLGILLRDLTLLSEELYDSVLGCFILQGPDYSEAIVKRFNPSWWDEAEKTKADRADLHGYSKISDIMRALNPLSGELWLRALQMQKMGSKMASLLGGKHPHIQTFIPGGAAKTVSPSDLEAYAGILSKHVAFTKEFTAIFDDLADFLYSVGYGEAGARKSNLLSYGTYEDIEVYNAKYENMSAWGERRAVTPGVIIDGELVTTDLIEINLGVSEFVEHSYYKEWNGKRIDRDPLGNEVAKEHPWNEDTIPSPGPWKNWDGKYSWVRAPRWHDWKSRVDGKYHVLEVGPLARLWATAKAKKVPESTGTSLKFTLPSANVSGFRIADEMTLEWKVPEKPNTIERLRARAYFHAYSAYVAYSRVLKALELISQGKTAVWTPYERPKTGLGVGMNEAMRGALGHWVIMKNGVIESYQLVVPTTWNASPRDPFGQPGPYEEAIIGTPITESGSEELSGVDVARTVRSFDPCLACAVHVYVGDHACKRQLIITPR